MSTRENIRLIARTSFEKFNQMCTQRTMKKKKYRSRGGGANGLLYCFLSKHYTCKHGWPSFFCQHFIFLGGRGVLKGEGASNWTIYFGHFRLRYRMGIFLGVCYDFKYF